MPVLLDPLRSVRHLLAGAAAASLAACAGAGGPATTATPSPQGSAGAAGQTAPWTVGTSEHADLWLHGFAMLMDDTTRVPLFRRGYAADLRAVRSRGGVTTRLDAERDRLRARFAVSPQLALNAQFIPFAFPSWETLRRAIDLFLQSGGDPQRAGDQQTAQAIAFLAGTFPTAADREWLRVFAGALDDEYARFYRDHWAATRRDRAATIAAVESAWQALLPRIRRFLDNSQQRGGEILLSQPLGGEGRTAGGGGRNNLVAVTFPSTPAAANEALYTAVHEFVGSTANAIVADHVSPADQRAGVANRYVSAAQVRGGLMLLQRTAPDLAPGYARFYLGQAGGRATGDPVAALGETFPLPAEIVDALGKQIDLVLGGI